MFIRMLCSLVGHEWVLVKANPDFLRCSSCDAIKRLK